ncbi:MAG: 4-(cytidine 5'-diphospho)-2-C-methyl-D-erythritol kinase [Ferruginibacter sp.]
MVSFPNCKINIGLNILSKREDGYHNLQTIFYPVAIKDIIEIIPSDDKEAVIYSHSGLDIFGKAENNLCIKAYQLLQQDFPALPHIRLHLHKTIPMGAGLGGGSADAAFVLLLLNEQFGLGLSQEQLATYALRLGSDCPFFIVNKPCFATGRGEIMEPVELDLSAYKLAIINPRIHVNTALTFKQITPGENDTALSILISQPVDTWNQAIVNDFEKPVFLQHPAIRALKEELYEQGALYASMSGSGSTVFGIFDKNAAPAFNFPGHYFFRWL